MEKTVSNGKNDTGHIVIVAPGNMKCKHCGATQPLGLPVSIQILTLSSEIFIR